MIPIVRRVTQDMQGLYERKRDRVAEACLPAHCPVIGANHVPESSKRGWFCRLHQIRQTK